MLTLRSVLCPVDFSDQSRQALRWAAALAARHGSRLTVVSAVDPLLAEAARARLQIDLARTETEPALRAFLAAAVPPTLAWAPAATCLVEVGEPSEVVLEAAAREQADLIVMGTHGLGGFRKWLLGSTTERVLRRTRTALLGLPPAQADALAFDPGGPRFALHRILMGTDFSEAAAAALRWAADLARELEVPLVITHVLPSLNAPVEWRSSLSGLEETREREAHERLQALAATSDGATRVETLVSTGRPADGLAAAADARQVGLIVVGLMSGDNDAGLRPGAIAYRVLSQAGVPVLIVPPGAERATPTAPRG